MCYITWSYYGIQIIILNNELKTFEILENIPSYYFHEEYDQLKNKIIQEKSKTIELIKAFASNKSKKHQKSPFFEEIWNSSNESGEYKSKSPSMIETENQRHLIGLQQNTDRIQSKLEIIMSENTSLQQQVNFFVSIS